MADIHPFLFSQDSWFSMCDICKPVCWQATRITLQLFENEPVSVCHSLLSDQGIPIDHYLLLLMSITADCYRHALFLDLFLRTFLYPYIWNQAFICFIGVLPSGGCVLYLMPNCSLSNPVSMELRMIKYKGIRSMPIDRFWLYLARNFP